MAEPQGMLQSGIPNTPQTEGMLQVTPELEAQGRATDTEVGTIDIDAVVIPSDVINEEAFVELRQAFEQLYSGLDLDINQFIVTPENTNYSIEEENLQAHLTSGELVVPPGVLQRTPGLFEALEELFTELGINFNEFVVGHPDNKINPETGLPEFWGFIRKIIRKVTKPIKKVIRKVTDIAKDAFKGLGKIGQKVIDVGKKVISSPLGTMVLSAIPAFAPYAQYITAAAKVASGQKLTAADFLSLGVKGYNDITGGNFKIDPNVTKAVGAVERIQDGADAKDVLIGTYGGDFAKRLGLDTKVKDALSGVVGKDNYQWISENIDFNQAAADVAAGTQPLRLLSNQFGDKVANYVGSGDPNLTALGYAGIRTAIGLDEGLDTKEALYRGAREYYDRGGRIPDFADLADTLDFKLPDINLELPDLDLNISDWFKSQGWDIPDLRVKFGDWKGLGDLGIDWSKFNLEGIDFKEFEGMSLPEIQDLGIDLKDIDFGLDFDYAMLQGFDLQKPKSKVAQLAEQQQEEDTFKNPLLEENPLLQSDELPISRQLLSSINLGAPV